MAAASSCTSRTTNRFRGVPPAPCVDGELRNSELHQNKCSSTVNYTPNPFTCVEKARKGLINTAKTGVIHILWPMMKAGAVIRYGCWASRAMVAVSSCHTSRYGGKCAPAQGFVTYFGPWETCLHTSTIVPVDSDITMVRLARTWGARVKKSGRGVGASARK